MLYGTKPTTPNVERVITMHEHDLDLVAAYADGTASSDDAARVSLWIDSCSECAEEFTAQQVAVNALRQIESVVLTDLERARMHRRVREAIAETQLQSQPIQQFSSSPARPGRWMRVLGGSAAAAVAVILAGAVLLPLLGGGNDPADVAVDVADEATTETSAAADFAAAESAPAPNADDTFGAAAAEGMEQLTTPLPRVQPLGDLTLDDLAALAVAMDSDVLESEDTATADIARDAPVVTNRDGSAFLAAEAGLQCLEPGLQAVGGSVHLLGVATLDGHPIEVFQFGGSVIALSAIDCSVVYATDQ